MQGHFGKQSPFHCVQLDTDLIGYQLCGAICCHDRLRIALVSAGLVVHVTIQSRNFLGSNYTVRYLSAVAGSVAGLQDRGPL